MTFPKNAQLIDNICEVLIRSVDDTVELPSLETVYHTPSKIQYSIESRRSPNGNLHNKTLVLSYPGLSEGDFEKFDELIRGVYQVYLRLDNNDYYEVSNDLFPMSCSTRFNVRSGHELVFTVSAPTNLKYIATNTNGLAGKGGLEEMFDYDFDFNLN